MVDPERAVRWLTETTLDEPAALFDGLIGELVATGVPIARLRAGLPRLHPELAATAVTWIRGQRATATSISHSFLELTRRQFGARTSPIGMIMTGATEVRRRITPESVAELPPLAEMQAAGMTDYFVTSLPTGTSHKLMTVAFASFATDVPGGFTEEALGALRAIRTMLGRRLELIAAYASTRELLEVYLGQNAARRILAGNFKRGTGELLTAVIWFCDLRGFTGLVDTTPVGEVVQRLDAHFDRVARPVLELGGEVLKFIGDAVLAIFPVGDDAPAACRRALEAATAALDAVAQSEQRIGVALHLGEVMYGNIGAAERLDFTVIGRAVNEVCRVEALCKETGAPLLATGAFASAHGAGPLTSLGRFTLRGVAEPAELFTHTRYRSAP